MGKVLDISSRCLVFGMIHIEAIPGTPKYKGNVDKIVEKAQQEANIYKKYKLDGVILENMHDIPYVQSKHFGPEVVATLTRCALAVKSVLPKEMICGLQILALGNKEALAVSKIANLDFIRAEGFVFSHVADEGFTDACAGELLRYRSQIDAKDIKVYTDIKKKHSAHSITSDVSLLETAHAAEYFLSDGIIITGTATGTAASPNDLHELYGKLNIPILIGSGVTTDNLKDYYAHTNAVIVGSYFKKSGHWANELCEERIEKFMNEITRLRNL